MYRYVGICLWCDKHGNYKRFWGILANLVWGQEAAIGCKRMDVVGGFKEHNNILHASNVSIEKSDAAEKQKQRKRKSWINFSFLVFKVALNVRLHCIFMLFFVYTPWPEFSSAHVHSCSQNTPIPFIP